MTISIGINGVAISSSPFAAVIDAGPTSAAMSLLTGPDINGTVAGLPGIVYVTAKDAYGNVKSQGSLDAIIVAASGSGSVALTALSDGSGMYKV